MEKFKDHFSDQSKAYSQFRPVYPEKLFSYLSSLTEDHDRAWDCATGSGQSAVALSSFYTEVTGTDASRNQIRNAKRSKGVIYKNERAEKTSFMDETVDLITVAQALHWFDIEGFTKEVKRVLKPKGIIAVWAYALHKITPEIDHIIKRLYGPLLDRYWLPERSMVEGGYKDITFPMKVLDVPNFEMKAEWDLKQQTGYLRTWSAVKRYEADKRENPVDEIYEELLKAWGKPDQKREIIWPLSVKVWRKI